MAATDDRTFAGSIAEIYDRYLVPLIFDSYALDLASRLAEAKTAGRAGDGRRNRSSYTSDRIPPSCGCADSRNRSKSTDA